MTDTGPHTVLHTADLIPTAWQSNEATYVFNPCIATDAAGLFAFYRVVRPDLGRRIAACRLDATHRAIPGTARPFSDEIGAPNPWYADPRLYTIGRDLFLYWNTGLPDSGNNEQYLVQVDREKIAPIGQPIRLEVEGKRQRIEKNWILFERDGGLYAIYSIAPHRVLKLKSRNAERMLFADSATSYWQSRALTSRYGEPRGGAQPIQRGDRLYHFCHASVRYADGSIYVAQCTEFDAHPPFDVLRFTKEPLVLPNPLGTDFTLPKLNVRVKSVVYPAGNLPVGDDAILVSYGVNDEAALLSVVPFAEVERRLRPVKKLSARYWHADRLLAQTKERLLRRLGRPSVDRAVG